LILRKIRKFDANRCQILRQKSTKFDLHWGSAPDPANSAPPALPAVFKGPTSEEKEGEEKGGREQGDGKREEKKGRGKDRERGKGEKGRGQAPKYFGLERSLSRRNRCRGIRVTRDLLDNNATMYSLSRCR